MRFIIAAIAAITALASAVSLLPPSPSNADKLGSLCQSAAAIVRDCYPDGRNEIYRPSSRLLLQMC